MLERDKLKKGLKGHQCWQKDFAEQVECDPAHLSKILAGKRRPSIELADRISRACKELGFEIDPNQLLRDPVEYDWVAA